MPVVFILYFSFMSKEIQSIIRNLQNVLSGEPWYGKSVLAILEEVDPAIVHKKPNENSHSIIELLYHSLTWAEFTLKSLEKAEGENITAIEKMNWREINPSDHCWDKGLAEFKIVHERIIQQLNEKDDAFLSEMVDHRKFNFRFLLNGLIQHDIYHLGQIAYIMKLLS
jgi:uncharacterized damage-inducible protein DinB